MNASNGGQTLVEVVVAIGAVMLIVTGLIIASTASLNAGQFVKLQGSAVHYAQGGVELARTLRNEGWDAFAAYGNASGISWCLDGDGTWSSVPVGGCPYAIENTFARTVVFTWQDPKMQVDVTVSWLRGGTVQSTSLTTYLTKWE